MSETVVSFPLDPCWTSSAVIWWIDEVLKAEFLAIGAPVPGNLPPLAFR